MSAPPKKYSKVRDFLDNLGNEKIKICRNCNAVFSYTNESTTLCLSCDFEEEISTLPAVTEIEDQFEMAETQPAVLEVQPAVLEAQPVVADIDVVETTGNWDMEMDDFADDETIEAEPAEEVVTEAEPADEVVAEAEPAEAVVAEAEPAEAVVAEDSTELKTIMDAVEAEEISEEKVQEAITKEEEAAENVVEAISVETEAAEAYTEAVEGEEIAAEAVVEAVEKETEKIEAVIEASEEVEKLVEEGESEEKIEEALSELKEKVEEKEEAESTVTEAIEIEETAAEVVVSTSEDEEKAAEQLEKSVEVEKKASEEVTEAVATKEKATDEVEKTLEIEDKASETLEDEEPFVKGDKVSHGVYGEGTVKNLTKAGKHWSVNVDFNEGERSILGTFLTLTEIREDKIETKEVDPTEYQRPVTEEDVEKDVSSEAAAEESDQESEDNDVTSDNATVQTEETNEEEIDYGNYKPGTKVEHEIFGMGEVKESSPKGEHYRLMIKFGDDTYKTLLSSFVKISGENNSEAVVAEAEPAEAVVAEAVDDSVYKRPKKEKEAIIDLSKPEVQDAEMVDDD